MIDRDPPCDQAGSRMPGEHRSIDRQQLRHLEVSEATWNRWRNQYGGMKATEAKRLRELETENGRLKRLLAEAELDKAMLKELGRGKLLTPERRRRAAVHLQGRFGVSERRACRVVGQYRSTQRKAHRPPPVTEDKLRRRLRAIARSHPRWGWKTAHRLLRREGWVINRKRTQRLWREEGLRRPQHCPKRRRTHTSTAERQRAERPNDVWALDFQFDETADGRRLKLLNMVDEHTREALAMRVGRSCDADAVVATIEALVAERGAPAHLRMDNGPELVSFALREWCRLAGTGTIYIEPGSPWENPFVESFGSRMRDEVLSTEQFGTLLEAQVLIGDWKREYNSYRPHSSLGWRSPVAYATAWKK
ncbi:MAG: IS3 family transposase, partial [Actinomycetota bacterium]|nr:IS3 family transposase [Actinomycetota bacterium]